MHFISSDEKLNKVLVTGPADKISQAREILKRIDVPQQQGDKPLLIGPPVLKTYPVPSGDAEAMVKILQDNYKQSTTVRITAVNNSSIMAWAGPGDQFDIARLIGESGGSSTKTERIPLTTPNSAKLVETLKGMFKTGPAFIEALPDTNAIVVRGTTEQIGEVKKAITALQKIEPVLVPRVSLEELPKHPDGDRVRGGAAQDPGRRRRRTHRQEAAQPLRQSRGPRAAQPAALGGHGGQPEPGYQDDPVPRR